MSTTDQSPLQLPFANLFSWLAKPITTGFASIGHITHHTLVSFKWIIQGRWGWLRTIDAATAIGIGSAPMVLMICTIAGSVMSLQIALRFVQTGANNYVGGLIALAIIREIGPMFTALAVGCRNGTAMTAELANMSVTEQLDALHMMGTCAKRYLLVPRLIASMTMVPILTILSSFLAILGGMLVSYQVANIHPWTFIDSVWLMISGRDIIMGIIKAIIFGGLIAVICCTKGLMTKGGAPQVGQATRQAAIWTAITLIITDFLLTLLMFTGNSPF